MAKLVDALVSGTSVSNDVQVRVLFWAQKKIKEWSRELGESKSLEPLTPLPGFTNSPRW
jgi:hypothetical protein